MKRLFLISIFSLSWSVGLSAQISGGRIMPEILIQNGHSNMVSSVAFSPDGCLLASGSYDSTVKLWENPSGRLLATLTGHSMPINSIAFSSDGRILASGSNDNTVKLWESPSGRLLATLTGHSDRVNALAFSPDSRTIASGSVDKTVRLWEASSGRLLATFTGHSGYVDSVAFSPDGRTIASGSSDKTVKLWEASSGHPLATLTGHSGWVGSVAFSPDGRILASGSSDNTVRLWETSSGRLLAPPIVHPGHVDSVSIAISPDGRTLASGRVDDSKVMLWEVSSGHLLATLSEQHGGTTSVTFSPNGRTLASGSTDNAVKLWEVSSGSLLSKMTSHSSSIISIALSPDGRTLASGSDDNAVKLWEVSSGRLLSTLTGHSQYVCSVAFGPDGRTLASGSCDSTVKLWEVASGRLLSTLTGHSGFSCPVFIAFSPDGRNLASGGFDKTVNLWEIPSGRLLATLTGHSMAVNSIAFSPDGRTLASGSSDNTIKLSEIPSGRLLTTLADSSFPVESVAFSPDGRTLASGGRDSTVKLWEVSTGRLLATQTGHSGGVYSILFTMDGKQLYSGSFDTTIKLWDMAAGKYVATLLAMDDDDYIVFTPDGYFDCSPGAAKYITYRTEGKVYGLDQYEAVYRRPDIIARRLGGEVSEFVAARSTWQQAAPTEFIIPPMLTIVEPADNAKVQLENAQLTIVAMDPKYPVTSVMIKVNGRPIPGSSELGVTVAQKGTKVTQSFPVTLAARENVITAAAYNEKGIRSDFAETRITLEKKTSGRSLFLLALAVNEYPMSANPATWKLKAPVADARALAAAFAAQKGRLYQDVKTKLLLGADATAANFSTAIYEFIKTQAQPEDVVVIYLAGHGVIFDRKYYFVTGDADPEKPYKGLNWSVFEDAMKNDLDYIGKVVVINDTCKSGALTRGGAAENAELFRQLSEAYGVYHMSATTSTEEALDGVFTKTLIQGLAGKADADKDKAVTLDELTRYVRAEVAKASGGRMHPQMKDIREGMDFPIAVTQ